MTMLRLFYATLILSPAVGAMASGDFDPIAMDEIEGAKAARLMKNKEDIDTQSTYHENDIKDTGDVTDEYAARLVRNRGPITAKLTASGSHNHHCFGSYRDDSACHAKLSLSVWKFAGKEGSVHGVIEEKFGNGEMLKVDVDCMIRDEFNKEAIIGGVITAAPKPSKEFPNSLEHYFGKHVYVKVVDDALKGDYISALLFDASEKGNTSCDKENKFEINYDENVDDPNVVLCSKHGDWESCVAKMTG
mmetsp:Transcript_26874/g.38425  ORF Transcript_26874/g.38425 Transcript_26874/m.38425 type:complete len:247 (+) Transcript_26874:111-851(+)